MDTSPPWIWEIIVSRVDLFGTACVPNNLCPCGSQNETLEFWVPGRMSLQPSISKAKLRPARFSMVFKRQRHGTQGGTFSEGPGAAEAPRLEGAQRAGVPR